MGVFSAVVTEFWDAVFVGRLGRTRRFGVAVYAGLGENRRVMILDLGDAVRAVLAPSVARAVGVAGSDVRVSFGESDLRQALRDAGVVLHGADRLHYFLGADRERLRRESDGSGVRRLTGGDERVFAEFVAVAPAQDFDDAYVELDHWVVFGAFAGDRLVSAASAYPWGGGRIADVGVVTLPDSRGHGHARAVVRALCRYAVRQGHEPQYRCQFDNDPSIALARSAGLTYFGSWEVAAQPHPR